MPLMTPQDQQDQSGPFGGAAGSTLQSVTQPQPDLPLEQPQQQQQPDPAEQLKASLYQRYHQLETPPASGGPVRQLLQNFFADTGKFFMGDTKAHEQQRVLNQIDQVSNAQSLDQFRKAQASQYEDVMVPGPDGTPVPITKKNLPAWIASVQRSKTAENVANINAASRENIADTNAQAKKDLSGLSGIPITPDLAKQYGLPDAFVGKTMKLSDATAATNAQSKALLTKAIVQRTNLAQASFDRDTFGTVFGKDIPTSLVDTNGNTMGWKSPAMPTSSIKTQGQQSEDLSKLFQGIKGDIDKADAAGLLGPGAGRINEIMVGRVGADNPEFARLRTLMSMVASGALKAHFGARGGQQIFEDFKNKLDSGKMTAGDMKAALGGFQTFFDTYSQRVRTAGQPKVENWVRVNGKLVKQ